MPRERFLDIISRQRHTTVKIDLCDFSYSFHPHLKSKTLYVQLAPLCKENGLSQTKSDLVSDTPGFCLPYKESVI